MEEVCWSIFGTVCCAVVVGALTRGLEGFDTSNTQPFNIVSDLLEVELDIANLDATALGVVEDLVVKV